MCIVTVLSVLMLRADAAPKNQVFVTSVCEITEHPDGFLGRRVSFDAIVESDGIERTVLVDTRDQCPGGIVPLSDSKSRRSIAAMGVVGQALSQGNPGTLDKKITAHFLGVLSMGKAEDFGSRAKVVVLTVEVVQDLKIETRH